MSDLRRSLAQALRGVVHRTLAPRRALLQAAEDERKELDLQLAGVERSAARLELDWRRLSRELSLARRPFSADMTIDEAWRRHPGTQGVFAARGLPSCDGCSVRFDETIGEAAIAYELDLDELLTDLNALLQTSRAA